MKPQKTDRLLIHRPEMLVIDAREGHSVLYLPNHSIGFHIELSGEEIQRRWNEAKIRGETWVELSGTSG